jgi:hypothetical protein
MPVHRPPFSKPVARVIVREELMRQTALPMPRRTPTPRVPGWRPKFTDYRKGLDRVVAARGN